MSQVDFEEVLSRTGMKLLGGNLTEVPWSTVGEPRQLATSRGQDAIWAFSYSIGRIRKIVKLEALANTDVIVCSAVLNQDRARTASPSAAVVSMRSVQI